MRTICLGLLVLSLAVPTKATIISASLYTKKEHADQQESKEAEIPALNIAFFGDRPEYFGHDATSDRALSDYDHKKFFFDTFKNLSKSTKSVAILYEANMTMLNGLKADYEWADKNGYVGLHYDLPRYAQSISLKEGNVTYVPFSLQSHEIAAPMKYYQKLDAAIESMSCEAHNLKILHRTIKIAEYYVEEIPRARFRGNVTIQKYLTELDTVIIRIKNSQLHDQIDVLVEIAKSFFSSHDKTLFINDILYDLMNSNLNEFINLYEDLFDPLNTLISNAALELALIDAAKKYESIIIMGEQFHMNYLEDILNKIGKFEALQQSVPPKDALYFNEYAIPSCPEKTLSEILKPITQYIVPEIFNWRCLVS